MAVREGFEPSRRFPAHTRSRRAPYATRPPLLMGRLFLADSGFAKVNPGGSRRRRASGGKLAEAAPRCNAYGRRAARWPRRRSLELSRDRTGDVVGKSGERRSDIGGGGVIKTSISHD